MFSPTRLKRLGRILSEAEWILLNRALEMTGAALVRTTVRKVSNIRQAAADTMSMLGKLLHEEANKVADKDRGPHARPLTPGERRLVIEAYGANPDPSRVRIVPGPGLSFVALGAFFNGNPAITVGNTIYLRWWLKKIDYSDLSRTPQGMNMMLHEYAHVMQYHRLGFGPFYGRYGRELEKAGWDDDKLYDYDERSQSYDAETLEGQAAMVGDYAVARRRSDARGRANAAELRKRLKGSGVYGL
jgi:hypothetical protein